MSSCPVKIPFAVVESKLQPQQLNRNSILRPRLKLLSQTQIENSRVILLLASAGYGKSTLMLQWRKELSKRRFPNSWLNLDANDNDPARFVEYWIMVHAHLSEDIGARAKTLFLSGHTLSWIPLLDSLIDDLQRLKRTSFIFLDDLHFISSDEVLKIIEWFIRKAPQHIHYIIGTQKVLMIFSHENTFDCPKPSYHLKRQ